ncbi:hypothetical protein Plhal304r1_c049g0131341 [Plasmopara halstedii]
MLTDTILMLMNGQNKSVTSLEMSYEATPRHSVVRDACGKAKLNPGNHRFR